MLATRRRSTMVLEGYILAITNEPPWVFLTYPSTIGKIDCHSTVSKAFAMSTLIARLRWKYLWWIMVMASKARHTQSFICMFWINRICLVEMVERRIFASPSKTCIPISLKISFHLSLLLPFESCYVTCTFFLSRNNL